MNTHGRTTPRRNNTLFKRALACALLAPLIYAISFGSAHAHANLVPEWNKQVSWTTTGVATTAIVSPFQGDPRTFECLFCVFHKQLFNTTVPEPFFVVKVSDRQIAASFATVTSYSDPVSSRPVTLRSGRAPPIAQA
jgi:hypothetical protein